MYVIINFIEKLTTALQSRSIDVYKAHQYIQSVIKGIQVCRDNIDEVGLEFNEEASYLYNDNIIIFKWRNFYTKVK